MRAVWGICGVAGADVCIWHMVRIGWLMSDYLWGKPDYTYCHRHDMHSKGNRCDKCGAEEWERQREAVRRVREHESQKRIERLGR